MDVQTDNVQQAARYRKDGQPVPSGQRVIQKHGAKDAHKDQGGACGKDEAT